MHFAAKVIEIRLQNRRLVGVWNCTETKFLAITSALQCNFTGSLSITNPLGASARSDQILVAAQLQDINRSTEQLARLASANFEEMDVRRAEAESYEESEAAVEELFELSWLAESWQSRSGGHDVLIAVGRAKMQILCIADYERFTKRREAEFMQ